MDLEEYVQVQLMYFIQKVMGAEEKSSDDIQSQRLEIDQITQEKNKLSQQVTNLEQDLIAVREELEDLQTNYRQLQAENERMSLDIERRADTEQKESKAVELDLRMRLGEKEDLIFDLKKSIEKNKKKYESELSQLKDDLELANSKLEDAASNEKMIKQYKIRLESLSSAKQQSEDLQKQNESLREKLSQQQSEYENLIKIKASYNCLKEELEDEKVKVETLTFNLDSRDKQMKKLEKNLNEYRDRALFFQKKSEELEAMDFCHEGPNLSEDSFHGENPFLAPIKLKQGSLELDSLGKELNRQKVLAEVKKSKMKRFKESFRMFTEDTRSRMVQSEERLQLVKATVELLQNDNYYLSEQIQHMTEQLKERENQSFINSQLVEELNVVKSAKTALTNEYKTLQQEKEFLVQSVSESSNKVFEHKTSISSKDTLLYECQTKLKQAQEQIKILKISEEHYKSECFKTQNPIVTDHEKLHEEVFLLKQEIALSHAREEHLELRVQNIMEENQATVSEWESKWKLFKEFCEKELKRKDEDMVNQIEEATNELMKEREQLVNKLQSEKRNSIMNFSRAMSVKEAPMPMNKEVFKLREVVMEKDKEIMKLRKGNKEIKNCWKQTAKLLKAVSKELGVETVKIEEAVRERLSL